MSLYFSRQAPFINARNLHEVYINFFFAVKEASGYTSRINKTLE